MGILLWLAAMLGVVPLTLSMTPQLLADKPLKMPLWVVEAAGCLQSSVLVALAVWSGVAFAAKSGLKAPIFEAVAGRTPVGSVWRSLLLSGVAGGVVGGAWLIVCAHCTPANLATAKQSFSISLPLRVLYGGFTEEILMRWGIMSLLLWGGWRLFQNPAEPPRPAWVWVAILGSTLLFAAGHLPTASQLTGKLTADVVAYVLIGNTAFGVLAGVLFRRYGLESAMLAHALAHVVAVGFHANP